MVGCLFVVLKGECFDVYDFVEQVKVVGVGVLLVSCLLVCDFLQVIVNDIWQVFGELVVWVCQYVLICVVVLIGLFGKILVKEMIVVIFSQCGNMLYIVGNLNNDIGVLMMLLWLIKEYQYVVIEFGVNYQGEIVWIVSLMCLEVVLVNNFVVVYLEGFGLLVGVVKVKGEIYIGLLENGIVIFNVDNNDWLNWQVVIGDCKVWCFLLNVVNSDFMVINVQIISYGIEFMLQILIGNVDVLLLLLGCYNIVNVLVVILLVMVVGVDLVVVKVGLVQLQVVLGCLFLIWLIESQLLLDDFYNVNVGLMIVVVQVLLEMFGFCMMVVGDMVEFGVESVVCYCEVGEVVKVVGLDCVFSVGVLSVDISCVSGVGEYFNDKVVVVVCLCELLVEYKIMIILVKGLCSVVMEEVVCVLQEIGICQYGWLNIWLNIILVLMFFYI